MNTITTEKVLEEQRIHAHIEQLLAEASYASQKSYWYPFILVFVIYGAVLATAAFILKMSGGL